MTTILAWGVLLVCVGIASTWFYLGLVDRDVWSISIYVGENPYELRPHPSVKHHPVLCAKDVSDVSARFVADPFMVRDCGRWYMLFEVLNEESRRGEIGLATSQDALSWQYEKIVLREPFHLSYPYVFEWNASYYMLPESRRASAVRLYRAQEFPHVWAFVGDLLQGEFTDPSIVFHDGRWWLFAYRRDGSLTLHYAEQPTGPWWEHPKSPVVSNTKAFARPGGRLIPYQGRILRYAQDGQTTYGERLRAFQIDEMTTTDYHEQQITETAVLSASGRGWNTTGMHHADAHQIGEQSWIACVDGNRSRKAFNWRKGAARLTGFLR
jgi:hypothetical protein